jgi:hypothetical protein
VTQSRLVPKPETRPQIPAHAIRRRTIPHALPPPPLPPRRHLWPDRPLAPISPRTPHWRIGIDQPPPITHPEYFYGFIGAAVAWQFVFLLISTDPTRYRLLMLPAILEKATFGIAVLALFARHRAPTPVLVFALIDLTLGALFLAAFRATPDRMNAQAQ